MEGKELDIVGALSHGGVNMSLCPPCHTYRSDHRVVFQTSSVLRFLQKSLHLGKATPLPEQNPIATDTHAPSVIEKINRWRKKHVLLVHWIAGC